IKNRRTEQRAHPYLPRHKAKPHQPAHLLRTHREENDIAFCHHGRIAVFADHTLVPRRKRTGAGLGPGGQVDLVSRVTGGVQSLHNRIRDRAGANETQTHHRLTPLVPAPTRLPCLSPRTCDCGRGPQVRGWGDQRRLVSLVLSYWPSKIEDASVARTWSVSLPIMRKPRRRAAGISTDWFAWTICLSSSSQISAQPANTSSTSSTAWMWV